MGYLKRRHITNPDRSDQLKHSHPLETRKAVDNGHLNHPKKETIVHKKKSQTSMRSMRSNAVEIAAHCSLLWT